MLTAFLHRRVSFVHLMSNWVVPFLENLAGMLFFMAVITGCEFPHMTLTHPLTDGQAETSDGRIYDFTAYRTEVIDFATQKMLTPTWVQIFLCAIGANWLVCFTVYISISSREIGSKIVAIWWPTFTFVALGLDHVIVIMYLIPVINF